MPDMKWTWTLDSGRVVDVKLQELGGGFWDLTYATDGVPTQTDLDEVRMLSDKAVAAISGKPASLAMASGSFRMRQR